MTDREGLFSLPCLAEPVFKGKGAWQRRPIFQSVKVLHSFLLSRVGFGLRIKWIFMQLKHFQPARFDGPIWPI
jgi:hypothetical protein